MTEVTSAMKPVQQPRDSASATPSTMPSASQSPPGHPSLREALDRPTFRAFQVLAYAEGGLLPAILLTATLSWLTGSGKAIVAVVGALHGITFAIYCLLVPLVATVQRWPGRTTSIALSVAFIPFAPWAFERRIHRGLLDRESLKAC